MHQIGSPFAVWLDTNRDQSNVDGAIGGVDRPDVVTSANSAAIQAQTAQAQTTAVQPLTQLLARFVQPSPWPLTANTVITATGNLNQWYNAMFARLRQWERYRK